MFASDAMVHDVVTITPETTVAEIVSLMIKNRIGSLPVLQDGKLVGIVTESDLIRRVETETEAKPSRWVTFFTDPIRLAEAYTKSHGQKAIHLMTRDVVTVQVETQLSEVATVLATRDIKRVPVLSEGRLVGILSRTNLVQALASRVHAPAPAHLADRQIREQVLDELRRQPWATSPQICNVIVEEGVAHLWGWIRSDAERQATIVLVENSPGVRKVVDHLSSLFRITP